MTFRKVIDSPGTLNRCSGGEMGGGMWNEIKVRRRRLHPDRRGCIDCGEILSRGGKWRCRECYYKYLRTLV